MKLKKYLVYVSYWIGFSLLQYNLVPHNVSTLSDTFELLMHCAVFSLFVVPILIVLEFAGIKGWGLPCKSQSINHGEILQRSLLSELVLTVIFVLILFNESYLRNNMKTYFIFIDIILIFFVMLRLSYLCYLTKKMQLPAIVIALLSCFPTWFILILIIQDINM